MNQTLHRQLTGIFKDVDSTLEIAPFPQCHIHTRRYLGHKLL
jgi:hypothetical protein